VAVQAFLAITATPISHPTHISGIRFFKRLWFALPGYNFLGGEFFDSPPQIILCLVFGGKLAVTLLRQKKSKSAPKNLWGHRNSSYHVP